jgi:hypothetical protein
MGKNYTPGHVSGMFSDWLKPYMQEYEQKREEREYKAPLGERNVGILNTILAGANTLKSINETLIASKTRKAMKQAEELKFKISGFDEKTNYIGSGMSKKAYKTLVSQREKLYKEDTVGEDEDEDFSLGGPIKKYINGGKVKKYQDGDFVGIPYEEVNVLGNRQELNPLEFRKPENIIDQLKPGKIPGINTDTSFKGQDIYKSLGVGSEQMEKVAKVTGGVRKASDIGKKVYGEATSALGAAQTLENKDSTAVDKGAAIYSLAEQGERGIRAGVKGAKAIAAKLAKKKAAEELTKTATKEAGKVVAKEGAKAGAKWVGKLAPGVGIGMGAHQIATSDNALGKVGGAFDVAAGVTSIIPGIGTLASGILGGIGTGLSVLGGVTQKPKKGRHIARW